MDKYIIDEKLGEGAIGEVFRVTRIADKGVFVMKKMHLVHAQDCVNDIDTVFPLMKEGHNHPNVVKYIEYFKDGEFVYVIMEHIDGLDLVQTLEGRNKNHFAEEDIYRFFCQIMFGLHYLHKNHLIHRDLKPESVLVAQNGLVKLVDFVPRVEANVAAELESREAAKAEGKETPHTFKGQRLYRAPEVWRHRHYTSKSDIWSCGCILYELVTRHRAFSAPSRGDMERNIVKGVYQNIRRHVSDDLKDLIASMLNVKPALRPSCTDVLGRIPAHIIKEMKVFITKTAMDNNQDSSVVEYEEICEAEQAARPARPVRPARLEDVMQEPEAVVEFQAAPSPEAPYTPRKPEEMPAEQHYRQYDFQQHISDGIFGEVYRAVRRDDDELFLARRLNIADAARKGIDNVLTECTLLANLHHPNLIEYIEHFEYDGYLYIIMEYEDGMLLKTWLEKRGGKKLGEDEIQRYFSQLMKAIDFLHKQNIVHRNIKPTNILITKRGVLKILNFGLAVQLESPEATLTQVCGTPLYMPPEMFNRQPYGTSVDIWGAGCMLYEFLTLERAFYAHSTEKIRINVLSGAFPPVKRYVSVDWISLLTSLLSVEPAKRPSAEQILSLPVLQPPSDRV